MFVIEIIFGIFILNKLLKFVRMPAILAIGYTVTEDKISAWKRNERYKEKFEIKFRGKKRQL